MSSLLDAPPFDPAAITLKKKEDPTPPLDEPGDITTPPDPETTIVDPEIAEYQSQIASLQRELYELQERYTPTAAGFIKADGTFDKSEEEPKWVERLDSDIEGQCLSSEFKEDGYRAVNRFKGLDYCHGATAPFHVGDYHLFETLETDWFKVEAVVHFGSNCEGARTWVHRGALGALMDDAANFAGYCVSGELNLFSGFTSKVFTTIKRPVRLNSVLKLVGQIQRVSNRTNVLVRCSLVDPGYNNAVHCEADCVFVMSETAAEAMEAVVERRQRKHHEAKPAEASAWDVADATGSGGGGSWDVETDSDPVFRPPNRVGRYGLGTRIDEDLASKIDESKIRGYVPNQGSLIKNAEKNSVRVKNERERQQTLLTEERERERTKNHPARMKMPWGNN